MKKVLVFAIAFSSLLTINAQDNYGNSAKSSSESNTNVKTKDNRFIQDNFPFIHISNWTKGMKFMIYPDDNHIIDFLLYLHEYKSKSRVSKSEYENKLFIVDNIEERIVDCPRGKCTRTYVVFDCDGKKFEYEFIGDRQEMANSNSFTEISDLIYYDDIEKAREILIGKKYYIISCTDSYINTPVIIKDIEPGNTLYPIKIKYETFDGKVLSQSVSFSGTNQSTTLVFNRFQNIFSSENPIKTENTEVDNTKSPKDIQTQTTQKNEYIVEVNQDVKSTTNNNALTKEELFVSDNFPYIHMNNWHQGMKFMFNSENYYDNKITPPINIETYKNKVFTIDSIVSKIVVRIGIGEFKDRIIYFNCDGRKFEYSFYDNRNKEFPYIDNFIYLDDIDIARKLLIGKQLYILSKEWTNDDSNKARKWVPVSITAIGVGSDENQPVKIVFEYNKKEYYVEISLSKTNTDKDGVFSDDYSFSKLFTFTNPKLKYPKIPTDIWSLICNEKVRIGMTKQQCRLSWGEPESINKSSGSWGVHEQWVYGSNSYLYFQNGVLSSIQN
ncbi:MAG: hypothetical protein WCG08_12365 [Paludibacter sp.]